MFVGGAHAGRRTDVQDFMVMCPKAGSFRRALEITDDVYRAAGRLMEATGPLSGVADEGGWWPNFASNEDALDTLTKRSEEHTSELQSLMRISYAVFCLKKTIK